MRSLPPGVYKTFPAINGASLIPGLDHRGERLPCGCIRWVGGSALVETKRVRSKAKAVPVGQGALWDPVAPW